MTTLYTVGHSNRTGPALSALLRAHGIAAVVDVRRYPASRRHPHFNRLRLEAALTADGIAYRHEVDLGGRRAPQPGSPNGFWREEAFRGYADHLATPEFARALDDVLDEAARRPTAVLCAEARPSDCHRALIADVAVARGVEVRHLLDAGRSEAHVLSPAARVGSDGVPTYPAEGPLFADRRPARAGRKR